MANPTPTGAPRFPPPPNSLAAHFAKLTRDQVGEIAEAAIYCLDLDDGDIDVERNGDELDGTGGEDDFIDHSANWRGEPGCPISDPGGDPCDLGEADDAPRLPKPIYGVDQTAGPINEREEHQAYMADLQGLERSPTGGWRRKAA